MAAPWPESGLLCSLLRTIGRLRIAEALPVLAKYFANPSNEYRWIVLQAAALIDGDAVMSLFRTALRDQDKRVVAEGLLAIRDLTAAVPDDIVEIIDELREDTTWVRSKDQRVGDLAATTALRLVSSPMRVPLARIYLARHCKTQWNLEGKLQGKTDLPLCEAGRKEAQNTAASLRSLNIDRIVTSTADRAHQTGSIFSEEMAVPIETLPLLRELDHGQWEGRGFKALKDESSSGFAKWLADPRSAEDIPGSVESTVAAQHRIVQAICEFASTYRGQTVLVIAHKHINALFMCHLLKKPLSEFESLIDESELGGLAAVIGFIG